MSEVYVPGTATAGTGLEFPTLVEFVQFLGVTYARQVADQHDMVWCPEWWRHPEATLRLTALHRAFEYLRRDTRTGLNVWWVDHADNHMAKLFDPRGPFKYCGVRNGHKNMLPDLPVRGNEQRALPTGVSLDNVAGFTTLDDFVNSWLSRCYARQVRDVNDTVWCPEWWEHVEARHRLTALWRSYEYFRLDAGFGQSEWWVKHADQQMAKLFDPRGPFKYCSVRNGHKREMIPPLRGTENPPPGLFIDPSREQLEQRVENSPEMFGRG